MQKEHHCPCPNLDCTNHGNCENCSSRHLRVNTLNYCAFYAILPELEKAIEADPNSEASKIIQNRIDRQMNAYQKCMQKHGLTEESQKKLREKKALLSN